MICLVRTHTGDWLPCATEAQTKAAHAERKAHENAIGNVIRGKRVESALNAIDLQLGDPVQALSPLRVNRSAGSYRASLEQAQAIPGAYMASAGAGVRAPQDTNIGTSTSRAWSK